MALNVDFTFDQNTYRHFMDGVPSVLHCHHYLTLTEKVAQAFDSFGGTRILAECAEDSVRPLLDGGIVKNGITDPTAKLAAGAEYYAIMGMGLMTVRGDVSGGEVTLTRSHVDQGWIKKFGPNPAPVNHFTCGYISAVFGAAFGKPARSYQVTEVASMVKGDPESRFVVVAK